MPAQNHLNPKQIEKLQKALKEEKHGDIRERIMILLLLNDGKTPAKIAEFFGCSLNKVSYWCVHADPDNLASHSGQSWSRQQLIEKIRGWNCDDTGEEQVVSVDIGQIRKKMIQVDATGSGFIKTIRGYDCRFDPPDRTAMAIY